MVGKSVSLKHLFNAKSQKQAYVKSYDLVMQSAFEVMEEHVVNLAVANLIWLPDRVAQSLAPPVKNAAKG